MSITYNEIMVVLDQLPPVTPKPCSQCPWRRTAMRGFLGPHTPQEWIEQIHAEGPIACHQTIPDDLDGWDAWRSPGIRQCAGAARFRANVIKRPRHPKIAVGPTDVTVFATNDEFISYHLG